jgi:flagellar hook-basal body complex protein FliE
MNEINPGNNISKVDLERLYELKKKEMLESGKTSDSAGFQEILKGFMTEVNDLQLQASDQIEKLASGEIKDLSQVMIAATEADTSFKIMMEIRNRLMTAYKEINKLGGG